MRVFLAELGNLGIIVFTISSMLAVGFAYTWRRLVEPLKWWRGVVRALIANFVLVPLLAVGVLRLFDFGEPYQRGLLLASFAAGAAFTIKVVEVAKKDIAIATTLLLVLLPATVVYMPFVVPRVVPRAEVDAWAIGMPLLWMLVLPLCVGLVVANFWPGLAFRLKPVMQKTSSVAMVVLILALTAANFGAILDIFGQGVLLAALLILGGAYLAGYVMGGRERHVVFGITTSQRNYAAALVVASQSFRDPLVVVTLILAALVGMGLLFMIAWVVRARQRRRGAVLREVVPISIYRLREAGKR